MNNFNKENGNIESTRKREYLKQQHQLRTMTKTNSAISADDMIENLLSKKEIFQKKKEQHPNGHSSKQGQNVTQWPNWVTPGKEPPLYKQVWSQVCIPNGLADTAKTSSLLLTSRLTTDTLGYIWSLTNLTVPGSLTQQELYISLALVALAQNGYTFTNANVVKQLLEAPLPKLDIGDTASFSTINPVSVPSPLASPVMPQVNVPTVMETLSLLDISSGPVSLLESPIKSLSVLSATDLSKDYPSSNLVPEDSLIFGDFQVNDDDFDDFKSADAFTTGNLTVLDIKETDTINLPVEPKNAENDTIFDLENIIQPVELKKEPEDLFPLCVMKSKTPPPEEVKTPEILPVPTSSNPAVFEDRYSALRILDSVNQEDEPEFGDFLTASAPSQHSENSLQTEQTDVQLKCLEACLQLLKEAVNVFEQIEDPKILQEVISDERGRTYLEEIVEVERIGRRIRSNRESSNLISEFESLSQALQPFIESVKTKHMEEQEGPKCGLCLMEYGPAHVKYGINHFHAPCANLYLHKVDAILPIAPVM